MLELRCCRFWLGAGELTGAMITLKQMMQEGLNPSGAAMGALIEAHAPVELHIAFKLLSATAKLPVRSPPRILARPLRICLRPNALG